VEKFRERLPDNSRLKLFPITNAIVGKTAVAATHSIIKTDSIDFNTNALAFVNSRFLLSGSQFIGATNMPPIRENISQSLICRLTDEI